MRKAFCDLCGKPAVILSVPLECTILEKVRSDKSAKIIARFIVGFTEHSTGFGGPPDLCRDCLLTVANSLVSKIRKIAYSASKRSKT